MDIARAPFKNAISKHNVTGVFKDKDMLRDFYPALSIPDLIQDAERLKFSKHYMQAAQVLGIAQEKMYTSKTRRLDYLLKYPMYLQLCGMEYNGWMEFNKIKQYFQRNKETFNLSKGELHNIYSQISSIVSLFQERKKDYSSAIYHKIKAYIESILSLYEIINEFTLLAKTSLDESYLELRIIALDFLVMKTAPFQIEGYLSELLLRTRSLHLYPEYFQVIKKCTEDLKNVDFINLERQCESIFTKENDYTF